MRTMWGHIVAGVVAICAASPALSATVDTWSGAGPNACKGECSQEWAEAELTPEQLAELRVAQEAEPAGNFVLIEDGTVFSWMSYAKDGEAVGYHTSTVAALPTPETARGWHMDGWSFVKLDACQNWAVIQQGQSLPVYTRAPAPVYAAATTGAVTVPTFSGASTGIPDVGTFLPPILIFDPDPENPEVVVVIHPEPPVPAVPLPATFWLLLAAIAAPFIVKRRNNDAL